MKSKVVAICMLFLFVAPGAYASGDKPSDVNAIPLDSAPQVLNAGMVADSHVSETCDVGIKSVAYWYDGWLVGEESYSVFVDPASCGCTSPFVRTLSVSVVLLAEYGIEHCEPTIMQVEIRGVRWNGDCPVPGETVLCSSPIYGVSFPGPGAYMLTLPLDSCSDLHGPFFISLSYPVSVCSKLNIVTDDVPEACNSYNNWGDGWIDLVAETGFAGRLSIYATVECFGPVPATSFFLAESRSSDSTGIESIVASEATSTGIFVSGDLSGSMDFTSFDVVSIASGAFAGKGFSTGEWRATLEAAPYAGGWRTLVFHRVAENRVYLKGAITGDITGKCFGYIEESVPGSGIYDHYHSTWELNRVGGEVASGSLELNGLLTNYNSYETVSELAVHQAQMEGEGYGLYTGPLSAVVTSVWLSGTSEYSGAGLSVVSYSSRLGVGVGWGHNDSDWSIRGMFEEPIDGRLCAFLRDSGSGMTLSGTVEETIGEAHAHLNVDVWGPTRVSPGQTFNYVIEYRNSGVVAADNIQMRAELPEIVDHVSSSINGTYDWEIHGITWSVERIDAMSAGYLSVTAYAPWGLSAGSILSSYASIYFEIPLSPLRAVQEISSDGSFESQDVDYAFWRQGLRKGDILLVHGKGGKAPGYWDHAGIYDGQGHVIESMREWGVALSQIETWDYRQKTDVAIFRVRDATQEQIDAAVAFARGQLGKPYQDWYHYMDKSAAHDSFDWYCSELVWAAYYNQGIDIECNPDISAVAPQEIAYDDDVDFVFGHGRMEDGGYFPQSRPDWLDDPGTSEFEGRIDVARDPNIKYGLEGDVQPGQRLNYTVEYENEGEGIAFGVYITDVLDQDLDETNLTVNDDGTYDRNTRTITWMIGRVDPHTGGTVSFSGNLRGDAPPGTEVINYATVYFPSVPEITRTNGVVCRVPTNAPPIADAGSDQAIECLSLGGVDVLLDGTGSSDPDNGPLTFTWSERGEIIAGPTADSTATVTLQCGEHVIGLTVEDDQGGVDTDEVVIAVLDTVGPSVTALLIPQSESGNGSRKDATSGDGYLYEVKCLVSDICDEAPQIVDADINGTPVTDGQLVILSGDDGEAHESLDALELQADYVVLRGDRLILTCTAKDACDNVGTATTTPIVTARSNGFWKNEFRRRLSGSPALHETREHLISYLNAIRADFDVFDDLIHEPVGDGNSGLIFEDVVSALGSEDGTMRHRSEAHGLALLLNLVSDRLALNTIVSTDDHVQDALDFIVPILVDSSSTDDQLEHAKDIADEINGAALLADPDLIPGGSYGPVLVEPEPSPEWAPSRELPKEFMLLGNRPNPLRGSTTIRYAIPESHSAGTHVRIEIYDPVGRLVRRVIDESRPPGYHSVIWDGRGVDGRTVPAGVYFYQLRAGGIVSHRKMIVIK